MNSSLLSPTAEVDQHRLEEVNRFQDAAGRIQPSQRLLKNRFEVIRQLGKGGFGTTYLAQDISQGIAVAKPFPCVIKQLKYQSRPAVSQLEKDQSKASLTTERIKRRFQREAQMMARLGRHYQLPCLLEHFTEGDRFYFVQEYIPGHTLSREISRSGPQSEQTVKQFLQEMIPIVRYIHRQNLLHLDIKPANIMRRRSDQKLVLIDFGAVRRFSSEAASSNVAGQTSGQTSGKTSGKTDHSCGTLGFSPKEQLAGTPTPASDIYSLGVTCLYLLTKVSPLDLAVSPQGQNLRWQETVNVSDHFALLLSKMLHPEADCRFQDTYELERAMNLETHYKDLKTCLTTEPITSKTAASPKACQITQMHAAENQSPAQRQAESIRRWQQRRRQFNSFTPS